MSTLQPTRQLIRLDDIEIPRRRMRGRDRCIADAIVVLDVIAIPLEAIFFESLRPYFPLGFVSTLLMNALGERKSDWESPVYDERDTPYINYLSLSMRTTPDFLQMAG